MLKRMIALCLCVVLLGCMPVSAEGASTYALPEDSTVEPMLEYAYTPTQTLSISSDGTATCYAKISGISSVTKIRIDITLQKKSGLFSWSDVETWGKIVLANTSSFTKTRAVTGSGTYRVKAKYTVYVGTASEVITAYSSSKTY